MYSNLSRIVLIISSAFFAISVGYYLFSNISNIEGIQTVKAETSSISQIEEYAYYDITDSSATLVLGVEPEFEYRLSCQASNGAATVSLAILANETSIDNLKSDTKYSCIINTGKQEQPLSGFETKTSDYLLLSNFSADAYALDEDGLFRATWDSDAPAYLVTRIKVGDNIPKEYTDKIIFDTKYTDDRLKVGYQYEYQIRALSYSDKLGSVNVFKFDLEDKVKLEDIKVSNDKPSFIPFRRLTSITSPSIILDASDIVIKKGEQALASTAWGLLAVSRGSLETYKSIIILDENQKIVRSYSLSTPEILEFRLSGEELIGIGNMSNNSPSHIILISPDGKRDKFSMVSGKAQLEKVFPYVYIEYPNGELIKVVQDDRTKVNISFENSTSLITWAAQPLASSYLLIIESDSADLIYKVGVSRPSYKLDKLPNSKNIKITVYAFTTNGIKLLGEKDITIISPEIEPIREIILDKAGSALIITLDSEKKYSHIIEISPADKNVWNLITEVKVGETSYFFGNVITWKSGSYELRITPKYNGKLGESTISNCELKVDKDINYQLNCK
jgi:hypothetical protein